MEEYIIKIETKVDGKWKNLYHEKLTESTRKDTMNVYVEHSTADKKKAKRFFDYGEAEKFAKLFTVSGLQIATVTVLNK